MRAGAGQRLSHYRLVEKIGEGGMGVVWKAEDTVLSRTVAIKVLLPDLARDAKRRRMFLEEARLASSVSHAHIVQVHELGREGDLDFIVMEYIEGEPLSRRIHGRPLPPDTVADWGVQVAKGLTRAHQKGLLHRDLKPANILITSEGEAKIVDFGLATLCSVEDSTFGPEATTKSASFDQNRQSSIAGTLPYMSPEQVKGEKLDPRSDIFSLGSILYEMTTGSRPFRGTRPADVALEILKSQPSAVHHLVPNVPIELQRIIEKALARRRTERYQTTADMAVDLKRLAKELDSGTLPSYDDIRRERAPRRRMGLIALMGGVALAALAITAWLTGAFRTTPSGEASTRTVLVLPMEVHGQAEGSPYVGRTFAEAIAINLAAANGLHVLPIPTAEELKERGAGDLVRAVREIGADLMVRGSLIREGKTISATLTLVDPVQNKILWGTQDQDDEGELARMASSIAAQLVTKMGVTHQKLYDYFRHVTGSPAMAAHEDLPAIIAALRRHDTKEGLAGTQRLIELFPQESEAHVMRVVALVDANNDGPSLETRRALDEGLAALERVDPMDPTVPILRANILIDLKEEPDKAFRLLDGVLARDDLTPACHARALRARASVLHKMGNTTSAIDELEEAIRLDPANSFNYHIYSVVLWNAERIEEAEMRARQATLLDPNIADYHLIQGQLLDLLERPDEALGAYAKACAVRGTQDSWTRYAFALLNAGDEERAWEAGRTAEALPETEIGVYRLACLWAVAGKRTEALRYLQRCHELGMLEPRFLEVEELESLRGDPTFERIAEEVKRLADPESDSQE